MVNRFSSLNKLIKKDNTTNDNKNIHKSNKRFELIGESIPSKNVFKTKPKPKYKSEYIYPVKKEIKKEFDIKNEKFPSLINNKTDNNKTDNNNGDDLNFNKLLNETDISTLKLKKDMRKIKKKNEKINYLLCFNNNIDIPVKEYTYHHYIKTDNYYNKEWVVYKNEVSDYDTFGKRLLLEIDYDKQCALEDEKYMKYKDMLELNKLKIEEEEKEYKQYEKIIYERNHNKYTYDIDEYDIGCMNEGLGKLKTH